MGKPGSGDGEIKHCSYCGLDSLFYEIKSKASRCKACWRSYYEIRNNERAGQKAPCRSCGNEDGVRLKDGKIRCSKCVKNYRVKYGTTKRGRKTRRAQSKRYKKGRAGKLARQRYRRRKIDRSTPLQRLWARKNHILKKYKITVPQVILMVDAQNGCCAICDIFKSYDLVIDHDHKTFAIRAMLCELCNVGLGSFRDSITSLVRAQTYLRIFSGVVVNDPTCLSLFPEVVATRKSGI